MVAEGQAVGVVRDAVSRRRLGVVPVMVRAIRLRVLPESRSECIGGPRPCPLVSCRFHLLLDVASDGRLNRARDFDENAAESILDALQAMPETCALDVADRGGSTSKEIGEMIGVRRDTVESMVSNAARRLDHHEFDEREHPEDFYVRYSNMGADEISEIAAILRARAKRR